MLWFRRRPSDDVAWYRHRNYKGNLSDDEKMELDSIRWQAKSGSHPAAKIDELPEEVADYISDLESECLEYRKKPYEFAFLFGFLGIVYCLLSRFQIIENIEFLPSFWVSISISIILLFIGLNKIKKIDNCNSITDEKFMQYWEKDYIKFKRLSKD